MPLLKETFGYLGRSFWGLPDGNKELQDALSRGRLYHGWGKESAELDDYEQSFDSMMEVSGLLALESGEDLERCETLLTDVLEMLRLRLKLASEDFEFLCGHRLRIELRDLDFKKELHEKIAAFMDYEEHILLKGEEVKSMVFAMDLQDQEKQGRKDLLESFDLGVQEVSAGIEAFYLRIKEYVEKG
jgi:hypothetical protein